MSQAERPAEAKAWRLRAQAVRVALRGSNASPHTPSLWVAGLQQQVTSGLIVFVTAGASCGAAGTHGPAPLCPLPFPSQALGLPIIRLPWAVQMWSWQPQHMLPWRQLLGKGPRWVRGTLAWRERLSANIPTSASLALRTQRPTTAPPPEGSEPQRGRGLLQGHWNLTGTQGLLLRSKTSL